MRCTKTNIKIKIFQYKEFIFFPASIYSLPNGVPNLPRVSSFQSTPPPSTSQGNTFHPTLALNSTPPLNHAPSLNHSSPPLLNHSHSYQQQQTLQQPFTNLEPYPPSTSTSLERRNTMPCKGKYSPNLSPVCVY